MYWVKRETRNRWYNDSGTATYVKRYGHVLRKDENDWVKVHILSTQYCCLDKIRESSYTDCLKYLYNQHPPFFCHLPFLAADVFKSINLFNKLVVKFHQEVTLKIDTTPNVGHQTRLKRGTLTFKQHKAIQRQQRPERSQSHHRLTLKTLQNTWKWRQQRLIRTVMHSSYA